MEQLVSTARMLADAGLPPAIVSAGGTGSYDISSEVDGITEIQAGSYALMDTDYARLGLPFEHALFVLGTVISRPVPERCVADCGHKSCTKDHGNPAVKDIPGASVLTLNDEHATIALPPGCALADRRPHPAAALAHRSHDEPARRRVRARRRHRRRRVADRGTRLHQQTWEPRSLEPRA